jgi:hypothetical protein
MVHLLSDKNPHVYAKASQRPFQCDSAPNKIEIELSLWTVFLTGNLDGRVRHLNRNTAGAVVVMFQVMIMSLLKLQQHTIFELLTVSAVSLLLVMTLPLTAHLIARYLDLLRLLRLLSVLADR